MARKTTITGGAVRDETIESVDIASSSIRAGEVDEQVISGQPFAPAGSVDITNDRLLIWDANGSVTGTLRQVAPSNLGITASPAGSDTQVQYNNGGSTGGASRLLYDDSNHRLGIGSTTAPSNTLTVQADASSAYVALIDNDAGSAGHGLKVTSDGTGAGTNLFDLESDSTTVFRVRGDGRVGIGKVTSLPNAVLTVSSSNTESDISIAHKIHHIGDSDTSILFNSDEISLEAGGSTELQVTSDGVLVKQYIRHMGDTNTHINFADDKIILKAGNLSMITMEEKSSAPHEVRVNNGGNNIDFVVEDNSGDTVLMTDASTSRVTIGTSEITNVDTNFFVSGSIGSKGTSFAGTALFGGDTVISGALHVKGGHTFQGSTTAAIILDSATASKIVWDSEDDGNSPDAAVYESGGSLYLSGAADVRIYAATDDVLVFPKDQLQVLEHADASGNFATFYAQPSAGNYNSVLSIADTGVIVNDSGQSSHDFRVESTNNTHMVFVDSGNDKIGINKNSPTSTLHINGSLALNVRKIDAVNDPGTTFSIPDTDCVILVNTRPTAQNGIDSPITLTLPDASDNPGMVLTIKDSAGYSDVNSITISAASGDNIDGNPSTTSINLPTPASFKKLISDGTNSWYEIGS